MKNVCMIREIGINISENNIPPKVSFIVTIIFLELLIGDLLGRAISLDKNRF